MNKLPKLELEKLPRPERKKRIKAQNATRKDTRPMVDPMTPEDFDRQMTGFVMIALGLLKIAGIDPQKLIEEAQAKQFGEEDMPESANDYVN